MGGRRRVTDLHARCWTVVRARRRTVREQSWFGPFVLGCVRDIKASLFIVRHECYGDVHGTIRDRDCDDRSAAGNVERDLVERYRFPVDHDVEHGDVGVNKRHEFRGPAAERKERDRCRARERRIIVA